MAGDVVKGRNISLVCPSVSHSVSQSVSQSVIYSVSQSVSQSVSRQAAGRFVTHADGQAHRHKSLEKSNFVSSTKSELTGLPRYQS